MLQRTHPLQKSSWNAAVRQSTLLLTADCSVCNETELKMAVPVLLDAEIEGMTVEKIKAHPRKRNLRISGLREDLVRRLKANVLEHENIDGRWSRASH